MQRIDHPDPDACNAEVLHELDNGADGLVLIPAGAIGAHGYGLAPGANAVERALAGVHLDAGISIALEHSPHFPELPLTLAGLVKRQGLSPAAVGVRFGLDPLGAFALHGRSPAPWREAGAAHRRDRCRSCEAWLQGPVRHRRRARRARCRWQRGAGAGVRAGRRRRLSARLRGWRHRARRRAAHDRVPADRRRRPVPDHREIPRHAKALAARRGKLRPHAGARLHRGGDRLALDDPRRRLCEHPARDHRRVLGRCRRRRCDHGVAVHRRARPTRPLRAPRCAQRAACPARRSRHCACRRPDRRRRLERGPDRASSAARPGPCSRRSKRPAASPPPSNRA